MPDADSNTKNKQSMRVKRMRQRDNRKPCLIYPEDQGKQNWDILMAGLLLFTCMVTPYRIAFSEDDIVWTIVNYSVDFLFLCDIIVIFFTAFYDDDFVIHEDRWVMAKNYFKMYGEFNLFSCSAWISMQGIVKSKILPSPRHPYLLGC